MKKNLKNECFNSIDTLPIWNWWKISETGNLAYLLKEGDYDKVSEDNKDLWFKIQDEYLEEYGINESMRKILSLKQQWIEKQYKFIIEGDRFSRMEADLLQIDIERESDTGGYMKREDTMIFLEEKLGREVDPKRVSVKKYNDYLNYYSK